VSTIVFIWLAVCGVVALLAAVWMVAYRIGFAEGRLTIPLRMIKSLAEHEVVCGNTDPEGMALELIDHLGFQELEARRLVTGVRSSARPLRSVASRSAT
jgi:hypothetical protein